MSLEIVTFFILLFITLIIYSILYLIFVGGLKYIYNRIWNRDNTYINDLAILITPIIFVIMVYLIQIIRVSLEPLDLILIILMLIGIAISMRFHKKI
jgi:hypothetical protein